jgi:hypothetical protein
MSKYAPLTERLRTVSSSEWRTSFTELERIIGAELPPVARKYRAWWSNNPDNSTITRAWLAAGFKTASVDMAGETLVFRKAETQAASGPEELERESTPSWGQSPFAGLKGTVRIAIDFDLTEPTGEVWAADQGRP